MLYIKLGNFQGVGLYKISARFNFITHQGRKHVVRVFGILYFYLDQYSGLSS